MAEVLAAYPGARRALFKKYHIGGCASCGFSPSETLASLCARNGSLPPEEAIACIEGGHAQDLALLITPSDLSTALTQDPATPVVDIRSPEEFEAARIPGSIRLDETLMQKIMGSHPRDKMIVFCDHQGDRSPDAAAYFAGHGFTGAKTLVGGLDAWSREIDSSIPRYEVQP